MRRFWFLLSLLVLPLVRAQSPDPGAFAGTWLGEVVAPNDRTAIGFAFERTPQGLITSFYMPAMFLPGVKFAPAEVANGELRFRPLDTQLRREGDRLVGTFGLSHLPVELKRVGAFPAAPPPKLDYPPAPAPAWTAHLGAETWASPVARDGTIYIGCADGKLHALDAANGHERWAWSGPSPLYGTALATAGRVYFVDARADLVCLERAEGKLAWRVALHDAKSGALKPNETYTHRTPTPLLIDDTLYVGSSDGGIYALDAATGAIRWRHDAKTKIYATLGSDGDDLLVGGLDGTVLALNRNTREETARTKLPGPVVSTPVAADGAVIVGCRDYMLYGFDRAHLAGRWQFSYWFSWVESTPALIDGVAYLGGSDFARITALDPASGEADWSTVIHGLTWGTPLVTADTVFAGTHAQGDAIIPHQGGVVALNRRTGAIKWRHAIPVKAGVNRAGVIGSLALAGENAIAVAFDGTVLAFPAR